MTLQDFFNFIGNHHQYTLGFFIIIPVLALLIGFIGGTADHKPPYNYMYTVLIYLISIPGIFAVGLNVYFFLFQRRDIMQTDLFLQVLPVVSMVVTIAIMRNNINLDFVPGFNKISGLWLMLFTTMFLMWFLEKIQIIVFSYLPFQYLLGFFAVLFFAIYLGWRKFVKQ